MRRAPGPVAGPGFPAPRGVRFGADDLRQLRRVTARWAAGAGLQENRADDFVIAVNEIATNAVRYGSPQARLLLRIAERDVAEAEVRDSGCWQEPAAAAGQRGGMGIPLARMVCDEVDFRTGRGGTTVTLRMCLQPRPREAGPR